MARVFIARPRLDCSFKKGPVPSEVGPPRGPLRAGYARFLDGLAAYHDGLGDVVTVETRPLWQFELDDMQAASGVHDTFYFPHKLRPQFPIGANALYYKLAPLSDYMTVDPAGWGASLSFLPLPIVTNAAAVQTFDRLRQMIDRNESKIEQPAAGPPPVPEAYALFVCQVPHDEAILFHSRVSVESALASAIAYAEHRDITLVVKGHPANPKSMVPLKALADASNRAVWVDDISIHTCLAGADRVLLVNSGVGMEAMLHGKPVIRFGRAEYDAVVPRADPSVGSIVGLEQSPFGVADYAGFFHAYLAHCIRIDDIGSYAPVLGRVIGGALN
jgi:hypothetical protein